MNKVGFVYHPVYLKHNTGEHVENSKRLLSIISRLDDTGIMEKLVHVEPRQATLRELGLVHEQKYISQIKDFTERGGGMVDAETVLSDESYEVARWAAGGVLEAVDKVMDGELDSAFAAIRPPGHHATADKAMGFCLFNNLAIAARYLTMSRALKRVVVIDFDVHHGNGIQEIFYKNHRVLYISIHQFPHFPGTGAADVIGNSIATGTNLNIPLPPYSGDLEYLRVFKEIVEPAIRRFEPQFVLTAAGYDAHWVDTMSSTQVTISCFAKITRYIKDLAEEFCGGKMVFALEGGYDLNALSASVATTLNVLLGENHIEDPLGEPHEHYVAPNIDELVREIKTLHKL